MKVRRIPQIYKNVMDNSIQLVYGTPKCTLLWLHGLGDTAQGFQSFFTHSKSPLYEGAPLRSVTMNDNEVCPSWYDIRSQQRFTRPQEETFNLEHIDQSYNVIDQHVKDQIIWWDKNEPASKINPYHRIFVGGFSQGGVMALHYGLQSSNIIAGAICKSGYLLKYTKLANLGKLPFLLCHGQKDTIIKQIEAKKSFEKLLKQPIVDYYILDSLYHTVCLENLSLLKNWLGDIITANSDFYEKIQTI